jgi:hypothetical protein
MLLRKIFSRDIDRTINPAVVVNERDKKTIQTEIEEYVFTSDLIDNLYKFLDAVFNKRDGKTAIWINGFYGSGKSHFIKYIHYCLNLETSDEAFKHFINNAKDLAEDFSESTPSNIKQLQKMVQSSNIDDIMFNIDTVAGQREDKEKITIILLNCFNQFRGYNGKNIQVARLIEKHLDKSGKFEEFKTKMNAIEGYNWERDASTIIALKLNSVLNVVSKLDSSIDIESLRKKIINPDDISIGGDLIPELVEYINDKPEDYRLIFLIDEVSQYIGSDTNLLLNLQTIIEEVGAQCANKIWIGTTAQQTLDQVVGNTEITGEDFGKILGRFETRISLQSQDAAYITKKRILDKDSNGIGELKPFYDKNKDAIMNQFHFSHDLYKGFENYDDFLLSYPFIPYQFRLISDVFDSFSKLEYVDKGVRNSERSVLGITHYTIGKQGDNTVGYFIPFDAFFNEQFRKNLTNTAIQIIDRAMALNFVKKGDFAKRVVFTLFMISNLSDEKKVIFPTNLDNLTILLMDKPDINRLDLQNKVQKVLDELIKKNIIREEQQQYYFFKEDEIDVANLVQNTVINSDDRLSALEKKIFSDMLGLQRKVSWGNNAFNLAISFDDKHIYTNGDINVKFSFFNREEINTRALGMSKYDMVFCLNVPLDKHDNLLNEFSLYVKTAKFIRQNSDSAIGTRKKTIDEFSFRNITKLDELKIQFENIFKDTPVISMQSVIDSKGITSSSPKLRYLEALKIHFENVYKKHGLSSKYAISNEQLKKSASDKQTTISTDLSPAEEELDNWINRSGRSITLDEVIKHFKIPPFGWKDLSTMDMLVRIAKKNKKQFERSNEKINLIDFYQFGIKSTERAVIVIKSPVNVSIQLIEKAKKDFKEIFNQTLSSNTEVNTVFDEAVELIKLKINQFKPYAKSLAGQHFVKHLINYIDELTELGGTRDTIRFFEKLEEDKKELMQLRDTCEELKEFADTQISNYKSIRSFCSENEQNFSNLGQSGSDKANTLIDYFHHDDTPSGRFPQMKKIYQELIVEIRDLTEKFREDAKSTYNKIYIIIESAANSAGISENERSQLYTSQNEKIKNLNSENNISKLELAIEKANSFKGDCLKAIGDKTGKKSVTFKLSDNGLPSQIENENDLTNFLNQLKNKLQIELNNGTTIIIE